MNPTDIRSRIEAAAAKFTDEIVAAFAESFSAVASELSSKAAPVKAKAAPVAAKPAKKAAAPAPVAKPAKKVVGKRGGKAPEKALLAPTGRRSPEELSKTADLIVGLLASHKKEGLRIEQIKKQLGTKTSVLTRPIQKLLSEGKIKKVGEKRATTYFPG